MTEIVPLAPLAPLVALFAAAVFLLRIGRHLRVAAAVRPGTPFGGDAPGRGVADIVRHGILQPRMLRDPVAGLVHLAIMWGFVLLTVGTLDRITLGTVGRLLAAPAEGALWHAILALQSLAALLVLGAVGVALGRRLVTRPRRLTLSRDGIVILLLIATIVSTETLAEAFRIVAAPASGDGWAWLPAAIAAPLAGLPPSVATAACALAFWANLLCIAGFLAWLPASKHLHLVTAIPNVMLRKRAPRAALPLLDLEAEGVRFGVRTVADLTRKGLLDGFTCTECGRCRDACPAWASGKPLDPKALVMGIRDEAVAAEAGVPLIPWIRPVADRGTVDTERPLVGHAIAEDAVWDCVTCGACVEACPVLIEHVDTIVGIRRDLVLEQSRFPAELNGPMTAMERHGNPWGRPATERLAWTRGLPFAVPVAAEVAAAGPSAVADLECLYWVGCAAAFDDRNRRVARAFVTCLDAAGVRFAVLGQEETCTGDPARRMGNEYLWRMLADAAIGTLRPYRALTIVTACPHCFSALGTDYAQLGFEVDVVHHSTYLARLVADGRLRTAPTTGDGAITYHDACYLARYNGVIADPRAILDAVRPGALREMAAHGRQTACCGAGGGHMWMEEARGTRINEARTRQALETGATTVATACPFCLVMLRDGIASVGGGAPIEARDLSEILADAVATGRALPVLPPSA